jgi:hypothetical protein
MALGRLLYVHGEWREYFGGGYVIHVRFEGGGAEYALPDLYARDPHISPMIVADAFRRLALLIERDEGKERDALKEWAAKAMEALARLAAIEGDAEHHDINGLREKVHQIAEAALEGQPREPVK